MKRNPAMTKTLGLTLGILAGLSFAGAEAHAQALRPNMMILFDTSGSMLYNQNNDGSILCNNNANGQTSRIFRLKNALRDALAQVGTDEANFGLMRFPQVETGTTSTCPQGRWAITNTNTGCRMTTHSGNETTYATTWYDTGAPQSVIIPVTRAAAGLKPVAATDFDPVGANITSIYKWIDNTDSGMTGATNPDPELRSVPNANTPLGRSIFYARLYFENYVFPTDPRWHCRQNVARSAADGGWSPAAR